MEGSETHIVIKSTGLPGHNNEPQLMVTGRRGVLPTLVDADADPEGAARALANTRVVDIVGSVPSARIEPLLAALGHPVTLRARLDEHGACADPEDLDGVEGNFPLMVAFTALAPPHLADGEVWAQPLPPIPEGVRKWVLNIQCDPEDKDLTRADFTDSVFYPRSLEEVVIIFETVPRGALGPGSDELGSLSARRPQAQGDVHPIKLNYLTDILTAFSVSLLRTPHTFVDILKIPPTIMGFPDDNISNDEYKALFISSFKDRIQTKHGQKRHFTEQEVDAALARITFLTLDEYRQSVTPEQFELETVE